MVLSEISKLSIMRWVTKIIQNYLNYRIRFNFSRILTSSEYCYPNRNQKPEYCTETKLDFINIWIDHISIEQNKNWKKNIRYWYWLWWWTMWETPCFHVRLYVHNGFKTKLYIKSWSSLHFTFLSFYSFLIFGLTHFFASNI